MEDQRPAAATSPVDDRIYYRDAGRVGAFRRMSLRARRSVFRLFMETFRPDAAASVLDVGVSLDVTSPESNVLEQCYPHRDRLVCAGIGDGAAVRAAYPGVAFKRIAPHAQLPFADGQFDVVYSNAVVEHVGSRERQRDFVAELCRVGRGVFVVAPNRLFPVEHHTGLPFVHWLPLPMFRAAFGASRLSHWADEANLNPIFAGQLRRLFPPGRPAEIRYAGLGAGPFRSNIVAISRGPAGEGKA